MKESSTAQKIEETVHENIAHLEENFSELFEKAKPFVQDALRDSKKFYHEVMTDLPEGSNKIAGAVVAGLVIGIIGFKMGRNKVPPTVPEQAAEVTSDVSKQLAPVFKFIKLWMFYRLSV